MRIKSGVSSNGTWWNCTFSRVVRCPFFSGANFSDTSPRTSNCLAVNPPKGALMRTIWRSGCRCPYTPWRNRKRIKAVSSKSPALKRSFCASKLAISSPLINNTRSPASSGVHSVCLVVTLVVTIWLLLQMPAHRRPFTPISGNHTPQVESLWDDCKTDTEESQSSLASVDSLAVKQIFIATGR